MPSKGGDNRADDYAHLAQKPSKSEDVVMQAVLEYVHSTMVDVASLHGNSKLSSLSLC